jgi:WD40 repeat protein
VLPAELSPVLAGVDADQGQSPGECSEIFFTNTGDLPVSGFSAPAVTGDYEIGTCTATDCTGSLAPAAQCSVSLRGTASANGPLSGSLSLSASTGGAAEVSLSGTAHLTGNMLAVGYNTSPYIALYDTSDWSRLNAIAPADAPAGMVEELTFSPNGGILAAVSETSPYVLLYDTSDWSRKNVIQAGDMPGNWTRGVDFSPNGAYMAISVIGSCPSACFKIYATAPSGNWSVVSPPASDTAQGPQAFATAFSPDGTKLAVGFNNSPQFAAYHVNGSGPWAAISTPNTSVGAYGMNFNRGGSVMLVTGPTAPYLVTYSSTSTSSWTNLSRVNGTNQPPASALAASFSPDDSIAFVGHANSPYVTLYDTTTTPLWTKVTPISGGDLPTSHVFGTDWSEDGTMVAVASGATSDSLVLYNAATWTRITPIAPGDLPTGGANDVEFSPN